MSWPIKLKDSVQSPLTSRAQIPPSRRERERKQLTRNGKVSATWAGGAAGIEAVREESPENPQPINSRLLYSGGAVQCNDERERGRGVNYC